MKLLASILILLPTFVCGQLVTSTALSPAALVQNVLLGPGVVVSNVVFTGSIQAIGQFTATGTNLGLNSGIVITTGTVFPGGSGPQGPNDNGSSGVDNGRGGAGILNNISSSSTFNAALLEFDFTAVGDSVSFNYVFGSEEYIEYVDIGNPNAYNDVFGLFISGPGIINPPKNIAVLPNGNVVSINNVNHINNTSFYVDNGDGNQSPYNSDAKYIQYDGYTRVLTAKSAVQCGQTYHLTIAIADVGDGILDSGIFLEAQSLASKPLYDTDHSLNTQHFGTDTDAAEGCNTANFVIMREETTPNVTIPIIVGGTATELADYSDVPSSVTFAAGQTSIDFDISFLADGITEPDETLQLIFMIPNECGDIVPDTINLVIRNIDPVQVTVPDDTLYCGPGLNTTLHSVVTGGLEPLSYLWSTGAVTDSLVVSPTSTQTYTLTVTDFCLNSTDTDVSEVYVMPIPPIVIDPIPDISSNCPFTPIEVQAIVNGGSGGYTYLWTNLGQFISDMDTAVFSPAVSTIYQLVVSDACGLKDTIYINYNILAPLLIPEITDPLKICPGAETVLAASATSGTPPYSFFWPHSGEITPSVTVSPNSKTQYEVQISDACATYSLAVSTNVSVEAPIADFTFATDNLNMGAGIQFTDASKEGATFYWDLGNGLYSSDQNPQTIYNDIGTYEVTLIMKDVNGCYDTVSKPILIGHLMYIPNTFTPDGNYINNDFFAVSLNVEVLSFEIFNRWGELIYESQNETRFKWDGTYKGKPCEDGVYTYKIKYIDPSKKEYEFVGHVNLLK